MWKLKKKRENGQASGPLSRRFREIFSFAIVHRLVDFPFRQVNRVKGVRPRNISSTHFVSIPPLVVSDYKEDVIQTITNESPARKRGERRKREKSERAKNISKDSNLSPLFLYFLIWFIIKRNFFFFSAWPTGGKKNEDFVSLCLNYREIKTHKNPYEKKSNRKKRFEPSTSVRCLYRSGRMDPKAFR